MRGEVAVAVACAEEGGCVAAEWRAVPSAAPIAPAPAGAWIQVAEAEESRTRIGRGLDLDRATGRPPARCHRATALPATALLEIAATTRTSIAAISATATWTSIMTAGAVGTMSTST